MGMLAGWVWRDNGLNPPLLQGFAKAPGVIGAVSKQALWLVAALQQAARAFKIMNVAGRNQDGVRATNLIRQCVDFGGLPAP